VYRPVGSNAARVPAGNAAFTELVEELKRMRAIVPPEGVSKLTDATPTLSGPSSLDPEIVIVFVVVLITALVITD
jgi:hypothetical protein